MVLERTGGARWCCARAGASLISPMANLLWLGSLRNVHRDCLIAL